MSLSYEVCIAVWHEAAQVEIGLGVTPDDGDIQGLRQAMYKAREKARNPTFQDMETYISPNGKELWLCRKRASLS